MRGKDEQQLDVFSYISPEQRVPQDHPLRLLRAMTDEALQQLQLRFNRLYAKTGRPSIAPTRGGVLWVAEDDRIVAESSASRNLQGRMGLHLRSRSLQSSPYEESGDASDVSRDRSVGRKARK